MINNIERIGNFTSSEIYQLTTDGTRPMTKEEKDAFVENGGDKRKKNCWDFGKSFYSYVDEKNMERKLMRSLDAETGARPLAWGKLVEEYVFSNWDMIGMDYHYHSQETIIHPKIKCWSGSPDAEKHGEKKTVVDLKCPWTLKSFCTLVDSFEKGGIDQLRKDHKDGEKYYWQLVSNAILTDSQCGELIVYCPYVDELENIQEFADQYDGALKNQYFFIYVGSALELPCIIRGQHYKNINHLSFDIPQEDKDFLTKRVKEGRKLLIQ